MTNGILFQMNVGQLSHNLISDLANADLKCYGRIARPRGLINRHVCLIAGGKVRSRIMIDRKARKLVGLKASINMINATGELATIAC